MLNLDRFVWRIFLVSLITAAASCASSQKPKEFEGLERPPQMIKPPSEIQSQPADTEPEGEDAAMDVEEKKLNRNVQLTSVSGSDTTIRILEPFDQAWLLVVKALNDDSVFKVTDRNRDQGVFYVNYNPGNHDQTLWNNTVDFLTGGSESEGDYYIRLVESGQNTDVSAEMIVEEDFDDEGDNFADPESGVEKFLNALYIVLQEL